MVSYAGPNEFRGLSSDSKPTNARNGTIYVEMDTGKMWIYDEQNARWLNYTAPADGVKY